jgi:ATP-dependent phosphoenolpyruvate carboxykinase
MKIILNKQTKMAELTKKDGTIISTYSYKNMIKGGNKYASEEDFEKDINEFNDYLSDKDDFDDIRGLSQHQINFSALRK